jgi:hypothetical protein
MKGFQKANQLAKGRKIRKGGRPTKEAVAIKKAATEIARDYIESRVKPLLDSYFKLITGRIVEHFDKEGNLICKEEVIDSAAVRHAIDTIVPKRAPEDSRGNAQVPGYYLIVPPSNE